SIRHDYPGSGYEKSEKNEGFLAYGSEPLRIDLSFLIADIAALSVGSKTFAWLATMSATRLIFAACFCSCFRLRFRCLAVARSRSWRRRAPMPSSANSLADIVRIAA